MYFFHIVIVYNRRLFIASNMYFSLTPARMVRSITGNASAHNSSLEEHVIKVCNIINKLINVTYKQSALTYVLQKCVV